MILFGRHARTNLDALASALDGDGFRIGLDNFVTEKQQMFLGLQGGLHETAGQQEQAIRTPEHDYYPAFLRRACTSGTPGVDNRGRR